MLTCGDVRFKIRRRPGRHGCHGYATGDHWKWRSEASPRTDYDRGSGEPVRVRGSGEPVRGSLFFLQAFAFSFKHSSLHMHANLWRVWHRWRRGVHGGRSPQEAVFAGLRRTLRSLLLTLS